MVLPFPGGAWPELSARRLLPSGRALVVGFALIVAAVLAYVGARETPVFAVRSVAVEGAPPRVAAHVRAALRPLDGTSLLALNGSDVRARLARLPDVASARYDRDFPHTLRITVTPAHSIAVLRQGASGWIVSSTGRVVRAASRTEAPGLPRIWIPGAVSVQVGTPVADAAARRAVDALATARAAGFGAPVALVRASGELTFKLRSGLEIRFGDLSALRVKLAVARAILPSLGPALYLDVSAPDRPVAGTNPQVSGRALDKSAANPVDSSAAGTYAPASDGGR